MNDADKLKRLMDRVEGVLERMVPLTPVEVSLVLPEIEDELEAALAEAREP